MPDISIRPIGYVTEHTNPVSSGQVDPAGTSFATVTLEPQYGGALEGIEAHRHLWIIYWMHLVADEERTAVTTKPKRDPEASDSGVLATRSPKRPNPIGLTRVELLSRQGNALRVKGLDAFLGTPVLDIKPVRYPGDEESK